MKYKIKIVTFKTGRKEFTAKVKIGFIWMWLHYDGVARVFPSFAESTRDRALSLIDKHYNGYNKVQTIEFEYITKPN